MFGWSLLVLLSLNAGTRGAYWPLQWEAPSDCPTQAFAQDLFRERSSYDERIEPHQVKVRILLKDIGFVATLSILSQKTGAVVYERQFSSLRCQELPDAVFASLSVFVDSVRQSGSSASSDARFRARGYAGVYLSSKMTLLPIVALGPEVNLGLGVGRFRVEIGASRVWGVASEKRNTSQFQWAATCAFFRSCYEQPLKVFSIRLCAQLESDWVDVKSSLAFPKQNAVGWLMTLGPHASLHWHMHRFVALVLQSHLSFALTKQNYTVDNGSILYATRLVHVGVNLGTEVRWP